MSTLLTIITAFSLAGLFVLALLRARKTQQWRLFAGQVGILILCTLALQAILGFPVPQEQPLSRGDAGMEISFVLVLYGFMLLGMLAQFGYHRFEKPKSEREPFEIGRFLAPVFASPIIFIPLMAALQSANLDLAKLDAPRFMLFFVAFENGFFWKDYFDHRRKHSTEGKIADVLPKN